MKKKLQIKDLKVQSFVTNLEESKMKSVKGQGSVSVQDDTLYSCYAFVTCDIVYCAANGTFTGTGNVTDNIAINH